MAAPTTPSAEWRRLYVAANELMAHMGAHGEASARGGHAQAVMDALHAIDGGVLNGTSPRDERDHNLHLFLSSHKYLNDTVTIWQVLANWKTREEQIEEHNGGLMASRPAPSADSEEKR